MKNLDAAALCAVLLIGARAASAESLGDIYGNLDFGRFHGGQVSSDEIGARLGSRFGDYFGVEGEVNVGLGNHNFIYSPPCPAGLFCPLFVALLKTRLESSEGAYAVGYLPVLPNADLFARVGYGFAQFGTSGVIGRGFDPQGASMGAGAQYFIDGDNGLRFDYTHTELNSNNQFGREALGSSMNAWSIAFTHKF